MEFRPSLRKRNQSGSTQAKVKKAIDGLEKFYMLGWIPFTELYERFPLDYQDLADLRHIINSPYHVDRNACRIPQSCLEGTSIGSKLSRKGMLVIDKSYEWLHTQTRFVCPGCFSIRDTARGLAHHLETSQQCRFAADVICDLDPTGVNLPYPFQTSCKSALQLNAPEVDSEIKKLLLKMTKIFAITAYEAAEMSVRVKQGKNPQQFLEFILRQQILCYLFEFSLPFP